LAADFRGYQGFADQLDGAAALVGMTYNAPTANHLMTRSIAYVAYV